MGWRAMSHGPWSAGRTAGLNDMRPWCVSSGRRRVRRRWLSRHYSLMEAAMPSRLRLHDRSPGLTLALVVAALSTDAAGCAHGGPDYTASEPSRIAVTDLTPRFLAFYDSAT